MDFSPREKKSGGWKQRGDSTTWLSLGTRNHEETERHSVKGARLGWERGGGGRSTFLGHCLCTSKFVWSGVWTMEKRKGDWFTLWYNPLSRSRSPRSPSASASSASTTYSTDTDVGVVVSLPLSIPLLPPTLPLLRLRRLRVTARIHDIFVSPVASPMTNRFTEEEEWKRCEQEVVEASTNTVPTLRAVNEWISWFDNPMIICNQIFVFDYFI